MIPFENRNEQDPVDFQKFKKIKLYFGLMPGIRVALENAFIEQD